MVLHNHLPLHPLYNKFRLVDRRLRQLVSDELVLLSVMLGDNKEWLSRQPQHTSLFKSVGQTTQYRTMQDTSNVIKCLNSFYHLCFIMNISPPHHTSNNSFTEMVKISGNITLNGWTLPYMIGIHPMASHSLHSGAKVLIVQFSASLALT